ncbi:MAG TPA: CsgG/HfaB family protein [bacterium]|nr:CsgG/HfaB family protein [bacterium]
MRKLTTILIASLFVLAAFSCGGPKKQAAIAPADTVDYSKLVTHGPKKRIAIAEFINKTQYAKGRIGTQASDQLATHLVKSNAFIVIEREQLAKVMGEQALGQTGAVKGETAAKVGELLGAQSLITGSITEFGFTQGTTDGGLFKKKVQKVRAVVNIRAIDTSTGAILFAENGEGVAETEDTQVFGFGSKSGYDETLNDKALNQAIVKLVSNIVKNLDKVQWSGRVVKVTDSGKLIINAGQETGLQMGDTFTVSKLGEMLTDPETGMSLGREPGETRGKVKITSLEEKMSICDVVEGQGFEAGDQIKMVD